MNTKYYLLFLTILLSSILLISCVHYLSFPKEEWPEVQFPKAQDICDIEGTFNNIGVVSKNSEPAFDHARKPETFPLFGMLNLHEIHRDYRHAINIEASSHISIEQPNIDKLVYSVWLGDELVSINELYQRNGDFKCTKKGIELSDSSFAAEDIVVAHMSSKIIIFKDRNGSLIVKNRESAIGLIFVFVPIVFSVTSWIKYDPILKPQ